VNRASAILVQKYIQSFSFVRFLELETWNDVAPLDDGEIDEVIHPTSKNSAMAYLTSTPTSVFICRLKLMKTLPRE